MRRPRLEVPPGYERRDIPPATLIARHDVIQALAAALTARGQLIEHARQVPGARVLQGRLAAYAIPIGTAGLRGVVRRNHHGGLLRKLTGSAFLWPTRAPEEMRISLALRARGVATPALLGIGIYRAGLLASSDVVTEEIADSHDLGAVLLATEPGSPDRTRAWTATRRLLEHLAATGVRHHDLNVKNVLLQRAGDTFDAYLLDVDRVEFAAGRDVDGPNRARLRRSVEKWRATRAAKISDAELAALRHTATSTP